MKNYRWLFKVIITTLCCFHLSCVQAAERQALIIDTDVGRDDIIAMLYLFQNPAVDVKAITIESNGNTHCVPAFHNTAAVLKLTGLTHVPMACGSDQVTADMHVFPNWLIAKEDSLSGADRVLPQSTLPVSHNAVQLLLDTLHASNKPITILALGPLTNLAAAYQLEPAIKQKIKMIYVMGGALNVPGNVSKEMINNRSVAEWNIYFDPDAAAAVLANLPVTLIPLDATNAAPLNEETLKRVAKNIHSPAYHYFYELLNHSHTSLRSGLWYFWDPLAAVIAVDEKYCEINRLPLRVTIAPERHPGATIIDVRKGIFVRVCQKVQVQQFEEQLFSQINQQ
jgi:inosine-uridine nucleoside N-ribohydrolase